MRPLHWAQAHLLLLACRSSHAMHACSAAEQARRLTSTLGALVHCHDLRALARLAGCCCTAAPHVRVACRLTPLLAPGPAPPPRSIVLDKLLRGGIMRADPSAMREWQEIQGQFQPPDDFRMKVGGGACPACSN